MCSNQITKIFKCCQSWLLITWKDHCYIMVNILFLFFLYSSEQSTNFWCNLISKKSIKRILWLNKKPVSLLFGCREIHKFVLIFIMFLVLLLFFYKILKATLRTNAVKIYSSSFTIESFLNVTFRVFPEINDLNVFKIYFIRL